MLSQWPLVDFMYQPWDYDKAKCLTISELIISNINKESLSFDAKYPYIVRSIVMIVHKLNGPIGHSYIQLGKSHWNTCSIL